MTLDLKSYAGRPAQPLDLRRLGLWLICATLVVAALSYAHDALRPVRVAVLDAPQGLAELLPRGARIIEHGPLGLVIEGNRGLTETLNALGARAIVNADRGGCRQPSRG